MMAVVAAVVVVTAAAPTQIFDGSKGKWPAGIFGVGMLRPPGIFGGWAISAARDSEIHKSHS